MGFRQTAQQYLTGIEYQLQRAKYALRGGDFSKFGEQQILWKYINELLPDSYARTAVDIGAGGGMRWSNTYSLFLGGWSGVAIEANDTKFNLLRRSYRNLAKVKCCHSRVDPYNISDLLHSCDIPRNFGVLSLDIDGNDYWVLDAILQEFHPALVVTEINEKIAPPLRFVVKFDPHFQLRHHFYGYSISALEDFCEKHNYGILALEYNNAFLAPRELAEGRFMDAESAYQTGYLQRKDRKALFPSNEDLEGLHGLNPAEAYAFLNDFYAKEAGRYYLATDKQRFLQALDEDEATGL
jgi:hypothetical protein